jgi:hypothetical protein
VSMPSRQRVWRFLRDAGRSLVLLLGRGRSLSSASGNNAHILPLRRIHALESVQPIGCADTRSTISESDLVRLLCSSQSSLLFKQGFLLVFHARGKREDRPRELTGLVSVLIQSVIPETYLMILMLSPGRTLMQNLLAFRRNSGR